MSRSRNHSRSSARAPAATLPGEPNVRPAASVADYSGSFGFGFGEGHLAAVNSMDRGFVYWPTLDTRREISSYARTEIIRKTRFLYANVGFARRLVNGIARMVAGTGLMPSPATREDWWNKLAQQRIDSRWGSAAAYDLAGKYNGYTAQRAKLRCRYRDGDVGIVLTRNDDGGPAVAIYEGHQIANGGNLRDTTGHFDGIRVNRHNRMIAARILQDDGNAIEIPAPPFLLLADYERPGQSRTLPIFAHAVPTIIDKTEIDAHFKGGIKQASRPGYYIQKQADTAPSGPPRPGTAGKREVVTTLSGKKVNLEKVFGKHGGEVLELDPGEEIKMLLDDRPHPNTLGFLEYLIRDASLGVDLSPEILWSIAKLGGAGARFVMQDAQSFVEQEQQVLVDSDLGLEYIFFLAEEIASGRLPQCPDPMWWEHEWIPPERWTVDYGRDGKLHLEQLKCGALTFREYYGRRGKGFATIDRWLDEYRYIRDGAVKRELDPQAVLAAIYGRASVPAAAKPAKENDRTDDDTADDEEDE